MFIIQTLKKDIPLSEMNTKQLILAVFREKPNSIFKKQEEIAQAISKMSEGKIVRSQSAISKAMPDLLKNPYRIGKKLYKVGTDEEKGYFLIPTAEYDHHLLSELAEKVKFDSERAVSLGDCVIAYMLQEKYRHHLIRYFKYSLEEHAIFDVISNVNRVYVIFEPNTKQSKEIRELLIELPKLVIKEQKRLSNLKSISNFKSKKN